LARTRRSATSRTLVATDLAAGSLKPEMTRDDLGAALTGHILGATSIVTRYGH
jgi:phosphatidylethanolamine-binding protein (PEBP) family uncharacterized protein